MIKSNTTKRLFYERPASEHQTYNRKSARLPQSKQIQKEWGTRKHKEQLKTKTKKKKQMQHRNKPNARVHVIFTLFSRDALAHMHVD